jgi:hypothetical protein
MLFVDLATGLPKTKIQLMREHSHVSLPASWSDDTLQFLGVDRVEKTPVPDVGGDQVAVRDGIEQVDGVWRYRWTVRDKTSDELAADQKRADKSLQTFFEREVSALTQKYSPSEIASWPIQLSEARAYLDDPAAYTPFMNAVVTESGENKVDYANSIIAKAETQQT